MLSKLSPLPHTQPNHLVNFGKIFNLVTRGPIRLRFSQILHFVVNNTKYVHAWVCTNISLRCSLFVIVFDFPRYSSLHPAELLHQSKICVCVCVGTVVLHSGGCAFSGRNLIFTIRNRSSPRPVVSCSNERRDIEIAVMRSSKTVPTIYTIFYRRLIFHHSASSMLTF